jgi:hypothetical protein
MFTHPALIVSIGPYQTRLPKIEAKTALINLLVQGKREMGKSPT